MLSVLVEEASAVKHAPIIPITSISLTLPLLMAAEFFKYTTIIQWTLSIVSRQPMDRSIARTKRTGHRADFLIWSLCSSLCASQVRQNSSKSPAEALILLGVKQQCPFVRRLPRPEQSIIIQLVPAAADRQVSGSARSGTRFPTRLDQCVSFKKVAWAKSTRLCSDPTQTGRKRSEFLATL